MPSPLLALILALHVSPQDVSYENPSLGLAFTYPSTWKRTDDKTAARFTMPLQGNRTGLLEVFDVDFRASIDIWTTVEKTSAENLKLNLQRQWQEEILGVPLLLCKTSLVDDGTTVVTLSGLLYSASNRKMRFRLSADQAGYDEAELAWRNALVSLRTTTGALPAVENPERNPETIPVVKPPTLFPAAKPKMSGKPPKVVFIGKAQLGEGVVNLLAPASWTLTGDGPYVLTSPLLSQQAKITVGTPDPSDPPGKLLMKESSARLADYAEVTRRLDFGPQANLLGNMVAWTVRTGKSGDGDLMTLEAVGLSDDEKSFWILTYTSKDAATFKKDSAALEAFFQAVRLEGGN